MRNGYASSWSAVWTIFLKDMRTEWRTREILVSMFVFGILMLVLFNFGLEGLTLPAAGVLWVAYVFAGVLGLNRSLAVERENAGLEALCAAPVAPSAVYIGKCLTHIVFMLAAEAMIFPFFVVFFNVQVGAGMPAVILVHLLGTLGFCIPGTLFSCIALNTRLRDILLPILLFPITVPVLIAAIESTHLAMNATLTFTSLWFKLLVGYNVIFFTVCLMIFGYILEE